MTTVKIAPSILSADFAQLGEEIRRVEAAGADWIHVDVMDGQFVPNITMGPATVEAIRRVTSLPLDVHLMINEPDRFLADFANAGADGMTVHVEACRHLHRTVHMIRSLGKWAGVAINPATPTVAVEEILDDIDLLLVMSVNPGFGGQTFIPQSLDKLRRCRDLLDRDNRSLDLQIDGGISEMNAGAAASAGASVLVAGSAIYHSPLGAAAALEAIRKGAERGVSEVRRRRV